MVQSAPISNHTYPKNKVDHPGLDQQQKNLLNLIDSSVAVVQVVLDLFAMDPISPLEILDDLLATTWALTMPCNLSGY